MTTHPPSHIDPRAAPLPALLRVLEQSRHYIAAFDDPDAQPLLGALEAQITLLQVGMDALQKQQQPTL